MPTYEIGQFETRNGKKWQVHKRGGARFVAAGFDRKSDAVARGVQLAKKNLGKLVVLRVDGGVSESRDYSKAG